MDLGLKDKIAFVAASSQGLGKSVALELAKEGAHVIINGRNKERLEATRQEIDTVGNGTVLSLLGDLSIESDRNRIINTILEQYKYIDILVTNTGGPPSGKFETLTQEQWDTTYQLLLGS